MHGISWLAVILSAILYGVADDVFEVLGDKSIAVALETPGSTGSVEDLERSLLRWGPEDEMYEVAGDKGNDVDLDSTGSSDGDGDPEESLLGEGDENEVSDVAGDKGTTVGLESLDNTVSYVDLVRCLLGQGPKQKVSEENEVEIQVHGLPIDRPGSKLEDEDIYLNTPGLVSKYGYPIEAHEVETEDGYILTMFRIPYGKKSPLKDGERKPAVLLQHGLMNSADDWVIIGPDRAFAYILADAGYDVWLGNIRGNRYSQKHVYFNEESYAYWKFSWHEHGIYDMPAQIDYVLNSTGHKQIYYVGHSMGTTMYYVGMSLKTEYNQKIRAMFSLAPIAYMNHMKSPLFQLLAPFTPFAQMMLQLIGAKKFSPSPLLIKLLQPKICEEGAFTEKLCTNLVFLICGFDDEQVIREKKRAISAHIPAGSSVMQFIHYAQGIKQGHFRQYDHGVKENMERYGKATPPDYNLANVTAPVYLFYGANDWLSGPTDIDRLHKELGNSKLKQQIAFPNFNHLDFMYAKDAPDLVYKHVLDLMNSYEKGKI